MGIQKSGSISSEHKSGEKAVRELQEWTASNKTKDAGYFIPNHSKILFAIPNMRYGSNWLSNSGGSENENVVISFIIEVLLKRN